MNARGQPRAENNGHVCLQPDQQYQSTNTAMAKSKLKAMNKRVQEPLPIAPWIYINSSGDLSSATPQAVAAQLISLIPKASWVANPAGALNGALHRVELKDDDLKLETDTVWLIVDDNKDVDAAISTAKEYQRITIKRGCNFASVNLCDGKDRNGAFGTNHLELDCKNLVTEAAAKKIFRWLCKFPASPIRIHTFCDPPVSHCELTLIQSPSYQFRRPST